MTGPPSRLNPKSSKNRPIFLFYFCTILSLHTSRGHGICSSGSSFTFLLTSFGAEALKAPKLGTPPRKKVVRLYRSTRPAHTHKANESRPLKHEPHRGGEMCRELKHQRVLGCNMSNSGENPLYTHSRGIFAREFWGNFLPMLPPSCVHQTRYAVC